MDKSNWGSRLIIPAALNKVIPSLRLLLGSSSKSESATDEPPAKKQKRGTKSSSVSQDAYDELLRDLAIGWASDTDGRSPERFCKDKGSSHMSSSLRKLIFNTNKAELKQAAQKDARKNPAIVEAAIEVIEQHFEKSTPPVSLLVQQVERTRQETNTIFNSETLKEIADSLDFNSLSRRSRDGERDINIHSRKEPDEYLKLSIFNMANRVTGPSECGGEAPLQAAHSS